MITWFLVIFLAVLLALLLVRYPRQTLWWIGVAAGSAVIVAIHILFLR